MEKTDVVAFQLLPNESETVFETTSVTISYLLCIFGGFISVVIMCGNSLVIISVLYFKQLHTPTNYLVLSLAVADLLVGLFILPFSILLYVRSNWPLQGELCRVRGGLDMSLCNSSILSLCFISVDRYYAVCQPLKYRNKINIRVVWVMILVTWTVATLIGVIISLAPDKNAEKKCVLIQTKASGSLIMGAVVVFFIPALVMSAIYLKILTVAKKQATSIVKMSKPGETASKMERKATKTLAVVMSVFLISWMPFFLCISYQPLSSNKIPLHLIQSFKWLGWSNSMLNPCVYAFFYRWFRSAFRLIITGKIFRHDYTNTNLLKF
ncbi:trace amine-associated receptor 4-like [Cynoglossus semilaevis]|uniref:trace amine-associated receptor 4-like n=1 Tax=Cynoglossus semilaevis TaxID=244447 RepID=UPI000D62F11E|nr:trace amine-associated receptor 4-like [Cynoglossus semilaevis]